MIVFKKKYKNSKNQAKMYKKEKDKIEIGTNMRKRLIKIIKINRIQ